MRVLLFGDGGWATRSLERLLDAGHEVGGVILRRRPTGPSLEEQARKHSLEVRTPIDVNDPAFVTWVAEQGADLAISVSYDQILRASLLAAPAGGFINCHAGALPRYRGRSVINWAIINGEEEIGLTVHHVDEGIDTGDVILQRMLPVAWDDTYATVLARAEEALPALLAQAVEGLASGTATRTPQDHAAATYFPARRSGDGWLDWRDSSADVYNKIRGLSRPGPGARTLLGGDEWVVQSAEYELSWPRYRSLPGEVVGVVPGQGVRVKTGDSTVLLRRVAPAGGEERVPSWPIGTRLGPDLQAWLRRPAP